MRDFIKQMFNLNSEEPVPACVDDETAVRKFIEVKGRVQGVGFRYFVQTTAKNLGVTGWVKNMDDGSVSMEVQGTPEMIDALSVTIKRGNGYSKIIHMKVEDREVIKGEKKFGITY